MSLTKTIYVLRDPETNAVRYVGATSTPLAKRLALHQVLSVGLNTRCSAWIRDLASRGLKPRIHAVYRDELFWELVEAATIRLLREHGADLLNMTAGGMGCHGCIPDERTRAKRSRTLKAHYAADPKAMAERQEYARVAARSPNSRRAASERMKKIWSDPKLSAEMRARMVGSRARKNEAC